ncbi:MAG TPA: molybdate ABC transporter permease subunit [Stenomitos sp.]
MNEPLLLTLRLSALTTLLLMGVGMPLAYWLARSRLRLKPLVEATVALPLVLPPTVLGFYLLLAMGNHGWIGWLWQALFHRRLAFTFTGLVIASVCYSLPFAVQPMQAAFQGISPRLLEAAYTLGATPFRTFWRVVLPNALPGVVAAAVLSFAHTVGEFGVILMVGGNIPGETKTVSIAIYDMVEALEYSQAGRLALVLVLLAYLVLAGFYGFNRRVLQLWRS